MRTANRKPNELRNVELLPGYSKHAEGSCLVKFGDTVVLCTATLEDKVPYFLKNSGKGWLSAEYGMLPRSTGTRMQRESTKGRQEGRTQEIQRLIGRSLRAVLDLTVLGERQIMIDCDVLQADGGTRTAAINGSYIALCAAIKKMMRSGLLRRSPIVSQVVAISCGIIGGRALLDLDYNEDSNADVDANFVFDGSNKIIEIQTTAEREPFTEEAFIQLLSVAKIGAAELLLKQKEVLSALP